MLVLGLHHDGTVDGVDFRTRWIAPAAAAAAVPTAANAAGDNGTPLRLNDNPTGAATIGRLQTRASSRNAPSFMSC